MAPDPAALAAIRAAARERYARNPGRPLPPELAAKVARLLPQSPVTREDAA